MIIWMVWLIKNTLVSAEQLKSISIYGVANEIPWSAIHEVCLNDSRANMLSCLKIPQATSLGEQQKNKKQTVWISGPAYFDPSLHFQNNHSYACRKTVTWRSFLFREIYISSLKCFTFCHK